MNAPVRTYLEQPSPVQLRLPARACDSHVHVFGPVNRFPYAQARSITPVEAGKEQLFALHRQLGIERCVIVQSMVHGLDNRVVEDALEAGEGRYLGVALVPVSVSDAELRRLAGRGFRGVRFNFMRHLGQGPQVQEVLALTPRLAEAGLHLQVHFEAALVHELGPWLLQSPVPVVIDHMGRVDARLGIEQAPVQALAALLEAPHIHVKISGIDRVDAQAPPEARYTHGVRLARWLAERFAQKCVWGTDWPHPNHTHIPDDGHLVDALMQILPSPALLQQVLVDNPQALYRFES